MIDLRIDVHCQADIRKVLAQPSQRVEAGQVLAEVDSLELRTVQLDLLQATAQLRLVERSLSGLCPIDARSGSC